MKTSVAKWLSAGVVVVALPLTAMADGLYVGANYSRLQYVNDDIDDDEMVEPDAITLRVGIEPEEWLGLEVRGAVGLDEDTESVAGAELSFELDELYGAYAKLGLPMGEMVMPYAIAGYTRVKGEGSITIGGVSASESDDWEDESYGAGLDINVSDTVALNLEYMRYLDDGPEELSAIGVGLRSAF